MSLPSVHGTAISIDGRGVLLRGAPGSGKSSLALRLIDTVGFGLYEKPMITKLIADDQVCLIKREQKITMQAPHALSGLLEIRGIGIFRAPCCPSTELVLVVDLVPFSQIERLPETGSQTVDILGIAFRRVFLDAHQPAAPAILRAALSI